MDEHAFSTDDPAAVTAYRDARRAIAEYNTRVRTACAELGGNEGPLVRRGFWGSQDEVIGLEPDGSGNIPDGWRLVRAQLEPRRGKPGDGARAWLAAHQPPDVRHVMTNHGLPRHSHTPTGEGFQMSTPALFERNGTLWACYRGTLGGFLDDGEGCTWTPRKLSEFYAAREAVEALEQTAEVASNA